MNIKIKNNKNRDSLNEGKNYQLGFGFVKKKRYNVYEVITPISACREYLNDVAYSENTGNKISAHGLSYEKNNILEDNYIYLLTSVLKQKTRSSYINYKNYEEDIEILNNNYENLIVPLNLISKYIGIKQKCKIQKVEDNLYLIKLPKIWLSSSYAISFASLLIRISQKYDNTDVFEYIKNFKDTYGDAYMVKDFIKLIEHFKNNGLPKFYYHPDWSVYSIHSNGILNYINQGLK